MAYVGRGPFQGCSLVPKAVIAWCRIFAQLSRSRRRQEAEYIEAIRWCYNDARSVCGSHEIERVIGIGLHRIADLQPSTVDIKLDWPATLGRLSSRNPHVEVKAVFILNHVRLWGRCLVLEDYCIRIVDQLRTNRTKSRKVPWLAGGLIE